MEEFPSRLPQIVGRIHFLVVVGLRATIACWLVAGGCPQLLKAPAVPCHMGFPSVVAYFIKPTRRISQVNMPIGTGVLHNVI